MSCTKCNKEIPLGSPMVSLVLNQEVANRDGEVIRVSVKKSNLVAEWCAECAPTLESIEDKF